MRLAYLALRQPRERVRMAARTPPSQGLAWPPLLCSAILSAAATAAADADAILVYTGSYCRSVPNSLED